MQGGHDRCSQRALISGGRVGLIWNDGVVDLRAVRKISEHKCVLVRGAGGYEAQASEAPERNLPLIVRWVIISKEKSWNYAFTYAGTGLGVESIL